MKTPQVKPSQRKHAPPPPPAQHKKDWKENPLVVSALAIGSTAGLFGAVIMPITNTILNNRIERLTEISANAEATEVKLAKTKKELASARADLLELTTGRPFAPGGIYPIGLNNVVIGTSKQEVLSRIPGVKWDEDEKFLSVSIYKGAKLPGLFSTVAFYLDKNGNVRTILYLFNPEKYAESGELIKRHLLKEFGKPYAENKRDLLWFIRDGEWVSLEETRKGEYSYRVYFRPAGFQWQGVDAPVLDKK